MIDYNISGLQLNTARRCWTNIYISMILVTSIHHCQILKQYWKFILILKFNHFLDQIFQKYIIELFICFIKKYLFHWSLVDVVFVLWMFGAKSANYKIWRVDRLHHVVLYCIFIHRYILWYEQNKIQYICSYDTYQNTIQYHSCKVEGEVPPSKSPQALSTHLI